jgi:hypothetical protein
MAVHSDISSAINCIIEPITVADYIRESLAENTRIAYLSDLAHFGSWAGKFQQPPKQLLNISPHMQMSLALPRSIDV